jgi:membrane-associated phospholipid phosphatase
VVALVVLAVGVAAALVLLALSALRSAPAELVDPERPERWLVAHAPTRLQPVLRHADRRIVGGAATTVVFVVVFLAALAVGCIFDTIDSGGGFARWDESAAEWGARNATDTSTDVLRAITQLGGTPWLLITMALIGVVLVRRHRTADALVFLAVVGIGVVMLNNGLKLLVDRERPAIAQLAGHSGASFPSGHSAAAAACWAAIALVVARRASRPVRALAAAGALVIAIAVAASRVLLGVHWLTDVIAGVIVGWMWFFLVAIVFGGRFLRLGEPAERVARGRPSARPTDEAAADLPHDPEIDEPIGDHARSNRKART